MGTGPEWFGLLNINLVIVCHCYGVSDRHIQAEAGTCAGDADEVARRCGAGTDCGGCLPMIEDLLELRTLDPRLPGPRSVPPATVTQVDIAS